MLYTLLLDDRKLLELNLVGVTALDVMQHVGFIFEKLNCVTIIKEKPEQVKLTIFDHKMRRADFSLRKQ